MTLTQKQRLDICKFLAKKLGKNYLVVPPTSLVPSFLWVAGHSFDPFTNPVQWKEVLDAAWADYYSPIMRKDRVWISGNYADSSVEHDNTPDSRAAAVLVAIAKAWGWTEENGK